MMKSLFTKTVLLLSLTIFAKTLQAEGLYIGGGFGADNSQYNNIGLMYLNDAPIAGALKGFVAYDFKKLNIELGYNYGLEKDLSTRNKRIAFNNSDFYVEFSPKYQIFNKRHALLAITGVSILKQTLDVRQGVADSEALEGETILNNGSLTTQDDFVYSFGLGYAYQLDDMVLLSIKYKYNMPSELIDYSSVSFSVAFNLSELYSR